jgi:hypothetical protein
MDNELCILREQSSGLVTHIGYEKEYGNQVTVKVVIGRASGGSKRERLTITMDA